MNKKLLIATLVSIFSMNIFAAEKLDCTAQFDSTTERVRLTDSQDYDISATHMGYDFGAFIYEKSINMIITKPAGKDGYRESISTNQIKPSIKDGNVNMFMNTKNELITFICKVVKK